MEALTGALTSAADFARDNPGIVAGVAVAAAVVVATQVAVTVRARGDGFLSETYAAVPLEEKTELSHNTRLFRFRLPSPDQRLGLPLGRHLSVRAVVAGSECRRPYTPTSSDAETGYFDLLVKVYPEPHGTMSRHMDSLELGDTIDVRGPLGKFTYERNTYSKIGMIAGGTGITPCWQVFRAILEDPLDTTQLSLIFANVTDEDILLREELDDIAATEKRFSVHYVLNNPPAGWDGGVGFVTAEMITDHIGAPADDAAVLYCGPPPMTKAMKGHLVELGYKDTNLFKF